MRPQYQLRCSRVVFAEDQCMLAMTKRRHDSESNMLLRFLNCRPISAKPSQGFACCWRSSGTLLGGLNSSSGLNHPSDQAKDHPADHSADHPADHPADLGVSGVGSWCFWRGALGFLVRGLGLLCARSWAFWHGALAFLAWGFGLSDMGPWSFWCGALGFLVWRPDLSGAGGSLTFWRVTLGFLV